MTETSNASGSSMNASIKDQARLVIVTATGMVGRIRPSLRTRARSRRNCDRYRAQEARHDPKIPGSRAGVHVRRGTNSNNRIDHSPIIH